MESPKRTLLYGYARHTISASVYSPMGYFNQRTNGPVNAHLISWPSSAQNIQNLENTW